MAGDTRLTRSLIVDRVCGYCAVFKDRRRGLRAGRAARGPSDGRAGLSKLNSMHPLTPRRYVAAAGPGPVDMLGRMVGGRSTASAPKRTAGHDAVSCGPPKGLPRKEVIQPHLPVRLPCYDFTPVTSPTFDGSLPCGLGHRLRVLLTPVV